MLQEITPVFTACPSLAVLRLQGCSLLCPAALQPLCQAHEAGSPVLPCLHTLDVSYCPVPCAQLAALLLHATQLQVLPPCLSLSSAPALRPCSLPSTAWMACRCCCGAGAASCPHGIAGTVLAARWSACLASARAQKALSRGLHMI